MYINLMCWQNQSTFARRYGCILQVYDTTLNMNSLIKGFAHVTTRDDIYKECVIPEGAFVIANIWSVQSNSSINCLVYIKSLKKGNDAR